MECVKVGQDKNKTVSVKCARGREREMRGKRVPCCQGEGEQFPGSWDKLCAGKMVVRVEAGPGKVVRAVLKSQVKKSLAKQFGKEGQD